MLYLSWILGLAAVIALCVLVDYFIRLWEGY
jgi:hypothetical protein